MSRTPEDLLDEMCNAPEAAPWLLLEPLVIARQSVEAGEPSQVRMLAGLLLIHAQILQDQAALAEGEDSAGLTSDARSAIVEALVLLERAADAGDELAGDCIAVAGLAGIEAEVFREAKALCV
jgi:hypothetical protein